MTELTPIQQVIAPASDRLCGDDLIAGPRTIKFTEVRAIESDRGKKQFSIRFEGDNGRPWIPCKTMARAMVLAWSITDEAQMVGRSVTVYRDPDVDFGKEKGIGGVRISHMSHLPKAAVMKLTVSQGKKGSFVFQPLTAEVSQLPIKKQTPEEWVALHLTAVAGAETQEALDRVINAGARALDKLTTSGNPLAAKITDAYQDRAVALAGEGRAVEDFGDAFDGAPE